MCFVSLNSVFLLQSFLHFLFFSLSPLLPQVEPVTGWVGDIMAYEIAQYIYMGNAHLDDDDDDGRHDHEPFVSKHSLLFYLSRYFYPLCFKMCLRYQFQI